MSIIQQLLDPPIAPTPIILNNPDYFAIYSEDPRPELVGSEIWTSLFGKILVPNEVKSGFHLQALSCLWKVRLTGTTLKWDINYGYKLKPIYDFDNWENIEFWEKCRIEYFKQYADIWKHWFTLID